ncbi:MAG: hypothetical protein ACOY2B_04975 [Pseudomonadota bacterium]
MMHNMMLGYGSSHWLIFVIMAALILYPAGRILARMGLSPFWSVLAMIPFLNLAGLWLLAFIAWPRAGTDVK